MVRNEYSLISAGTELLKVSESKLSLAGKARARPDQVRTVLESARQQGISATYRKVMNRLDSYTPLGYSAAGVVVESMVEALPVGVGVATGGNEFAFHAEFNFVPKNLCVRIPEGVKAEHAAFATVGAISLHAFRRSEAMVGEVVLVVGLGLVGLLLLQVARAAGVHVVGLDPSEDRCKLALTLGADLAVPPDGSGLERARECLDGLTDGAGADVVFLAAGTKSSQPVDIAADLARDRAKVVDVGRLPLDLPWSQYYEKELEVMFSRSYGPGRYDPTYELQGVDYPIGYVRWTERRNMQSFLGLVAQGLIALDPLVSHVFPFSEAVDVFESLHSGDVRGVGTLFSYPREVDAKRVIRVEPLDARPLDESGGVVRIGVIGCGNYASTMLLPHLADRPDVSLKVVTTATSLSAATAQERFGFEEIATDYREVLGSSDIDAFLVATRHDTHAAIVGEALEAGKAVFVEKPLALSRKELESIVDRVESSRNDRVVVGFNRRFAPLLTWLRGAWGDLDHPLHLDYVVNAGPLAKDSWYRDSNRYGSRFAGEGGHFIDTISWWLGEDPSFVVADATPNDPDDVEVLLRYPSGSVGRISYLTSGSRRYPKETFMVSGGGQTARLDNFQKATLWSRTRRSPKSRRLRGMDKGQAGELEDFIRAVKSAGPMPIHFGSLLTTTEATLAVRESARSGERIALQLQA